MKIILILILGLILNIPLTSIAGEGGLLILDTDINRFNEQITAPYDLRNRNSYIQVTNGANSTVNIHVQIFQHDRDCSELDFFDTLTPNDTVVYNLDNIVKNDGSPVPVNLQNDSNGYVVITSDNMDYIIGNFRIIDNAGYEYRANMIGITFGPSCEIEVESTQIANFNTISGAMYSDIIGYAFESNFNGIATNIEQGFSFDIFTFDLNEEPLSCDRRNFACGNVMNYGINEDYENSRGGPLLCPGGGLTDARGGYISFENGSNLDFDGNTPDASNLDKFVGFIGINNNDGTGSMDIWFAGPTSGCFG